MQRTFRFGLTLLLFTLWTSACARPQTTPAATPYPADYLPTLIAMTAQAHPAAAGTEAASVPTETPQPSPTPPPAVDLTAVFAALTPSPTPLPPREDIDIRFPGPLSKAASPLAVRAYVVPGARGLIRVELLGEDGRLLARTLLRYTNIVYPQVFIDPDLDFEIPGAAELGRLQIVTEDEYGRPQAQNSVHVLLLGWGEDEIIPAVSAPPRLTLDKPAPDDVALGGHLTVSGTYLPCNQVNPLVLELIDQNGQILGTRLLDVSDQRFRFETDLPYQVTQATPARLILRQSDDQIPGTMYLYSRTLILAP